MYVARVARNWLTITDIDNSYGSRGLNCSFSSLARVQCFYLRNSTTNYGIGRGGGTLLMRRVVGTVKLF